ncbi:16S rRNA (cytosine(1402)-N(4))-methyltransferase RsmH [Candidatus Nomurabacteria bacterium]|nr:16S rRNA (cytosine(1402)-N(4))-methyltransferase RsmH [Candidatus Nomurabacteria bacterium]
MESVHRTVLLNETIEGLLAPKKAGNENLLVLDCTFGGGGHSAEILRKYPNVKIIAIDQDKSAWEKAKSKFKGLENRVTFLNKNFKDIDEKEVDGIIFDLGLSSDQLENSGRGFSFMKDEPLLMTMKENPRPEDVTAYDIVNTWSEENLADIIYGYGEERFSRRIAKGIVDARQKSEIKTTFELVKIIGESVPAVYRRGRLHPATRTFQALRIAVNDELGVLQTGLEKGFEALKTGGRMSTISFHSLEDRIVKRFYQNKNKEGKAKLINKKPILAGDEELRTNPRARSAKLRVLEKI